jgi:hypothetical protein
VFPDSILPGYAAGHIRTSKYHQSQQQANISFKKPEAG